MRISYVAAVISGVVYFLIQAVWFTVFAGPWIAGLGWTPDRVADVKAHMTPWPYVAALVCNVVMALVLSKVIAWSGKVSVGAGVATGVLLWLGLVLTSMVTEFGFERKPASFTAVSAGAVLVGLVAMGAFEGWWMSRGARKSRAASV